MGKELRFDGKVVVITGAGNGLGRSHALEFARRGAKVVVNDLGGSHTGDGKSSSAADKVVEEIKAAGGEAAPNYDSVEDGDKIVKTAVDAFGRIDVLVNNAGILRDVSFAKMTDQDWDLIYRVHVRGAFKCSHAAWPVMRDQKFGRIIFTASAAGIYGNFGQVNYAMAKLGLVGMSNALAIEGLKNNVIVNTIAPIAGSRMTETVLPPNLIAALKPEYVTALVVKLCHESHEDGGGLYEVGGGFYSRLRWERTKGKVFRLGRPVSAEDVDSSWKDVTAWDDATHPAHIAGSLDPIMKNVEAGPSRGGNQFIDVDAALGYQFPEMQSRYDERDLAMYALGIGAAENPLDDKELSLVYEMHGQGMKGFPTYGVIPAINCILQMGKEGKTAPGMSYGLDRILHGEQYLEVYGPLPLKAKLKHSARIKEIWDKGSDGGKKGGAVVVTAIDSFDESGERLFRNETSTFVRGAGGWGGDRGPEAAVNVPPDRAPDAVVEQKVGANQALLYRLSGDWNPLHADPSFAKAFGYEKPILHGLCTFGYAARHVLAKFAPSGDVRFFRSIKVRFVEPVVPGETLVTEMWKESDQRILFRVSSKERGKVVVSNAAIELFAEIPKPKEKPRAQAQSQSQGAAAVMPTSADVFAGIAAYLAKNPGTGDKVKTVFGFKLKNPDAAWTLDLSSGNGTVAQGETAAAGCTLEISDADFMDMCTGKSDPMKLFSTGKLKIGGNVMASQKLSFLQKVDPNDVLASAQKRGGGGGGAAAAAPSAEVMPTTADIFGGISRFLAKNPGTGDRVKTVFAFRLKNPDAAWTLDLSGGDGSVSAGEAASAGCTLEIADADFMDMCTGKSDPMKLFSTGKLKIGGNVMASQKLSFLQKVDPNDVLAAYKERTGAGGAAAAPAAAAPKADKAKASGPGQAARIVEALGKRLAGNAGLAGEVRALVQLVVKDPDGAWVLDLRQGAGEIKAGKDAAAAATITVSDGALAELASGKASFQHLYQHGRLRVDGDVSVARRVTFLGNLG